MKKILVATDGSENSERALTEAKYYGGCTGRDVVIVTVLEPLGRDYVTTMAGYKQDSFNQAQINEKNSLLEKSLGEFDDFDGEVETKLLKGDSADKIIEEAEQGDYHLIIMGSRGLGTFQRTILGSTSNKVLNHANVNVFIIK